MALPPDSSLPPPATDNPLMSSATPTIPYAPPGKGPLGSMTPQQQIEALRRVQLQAEQRVKIGSQLFKAAEARLARQQGLLADVRTEQALLRDQVQADVARSLQSYDQWLGQIDERFTGALQALDARVATMERCWEETRQELGRLSAQAQALLDQAETMTQAAACDSEQGVYDALLTRLARQAADQAPDAAA